MRGGLLTLTRALAILSAAGMASAGEPAAPRASARQLAWLAGTWAGRDGEARYEEHWTRPVGGIMIGVGRQTVRDRTQFFEYLKILEREDGLSYIAQVGAQPEVAFKLTALKDREAVFENPAHDFPRKLLYRLEKDGTLFIRVTGERDGKPATDEYHLKRIGGGRME